MQKEPDWSHKYPYSNQIDDSFAKVLIGLCLLARGEKLRKHPHRKAPKLEYDFR